MKELYNFLTCFVICSWGKIGVIFKENGLWFNEQDSITSNEQCNEWTIDFMYAQNMAYTVSVKHCTLGAFELKCQWVLVLEILEENTQSYSHSQVLKLATERCSQLGPNWYPHWENMAVSELSIFGYGYGYWLQRQCWSIGRNSDLVIAAAKAVISDTD